jgi:hypothetical protein
MHLDIFRCPNKEDDTKKSHSCDTAFYTIPKLMDEKKGQT